MRRQVAAPASKLQRGETRKNYNVKKGGGKDLFSESFKFLIKKEILLRKTWGNKILGEIPPCPLHCGAAADDIKYRIIIFGTYLIGA